MTDQAIALFECKRYHAKITPAACAKYRAASTVNCNGCEIGVSLEAKTAPHLVAPLTARKTPMKNHPTNKHKVDACKECGRVMPLPGRGLCGKCYGRVLKAEVEQSGPKRTQSISPAVTDSPVRDAGAVPGWSGWVDLVFAGDELLLEKIQTEAAKERRDIRQQLLWIIDRHYHRVGA